MLLELALVVDTQLVHRVVVILLRFQLHNYLLTLTEMVH